MYLSICLPFTEESNEEGLCRFIKLLHLIFTVEINLPGVGSVSVGPRIELRLSSLAATVLYTVNNLTCPSGHLGKRRS